MIRHGAEKISGYLFYFTMAGSAAPPRFNHHFPPYSPVKPVFFPARAAPVPNLPGGVSFTEAEPAAAFAMADAVAAGSTGPGFRDRSGRTRARGAPALPDRAPERCGIARAREAGFSVCVILT